MYTRCPECQTAFRVTARQLQQAAGRVRCGHCGAAFDALVNLSEEHPSGVFPAFAAHTDGNRESGEDAQPAAPVIEVSESEQESQEIVLETGSHELDDLHDPASEQAPTSDAPAARGDDGDRATGAGEDDDDYVPEIEDTGIEWVVLDDETGSHWAQGALAGSDADEQSGTGDEPATGDLEDTLSREASALLGDDPSLSSGSFWAEPLAEQPSDPLSDTATHLWQPPDDPGEWGTDAEDETLQEETNGDELPMLLPADAERADAEPGQTRKPREDFNRPEVAEHEAVTDFAVESDAGEEIHLYDDLDLGDDLEPGDDRKPDNDRVPGDASELIGSIASAADAEQEDQATPPPEPAPAPAPPPARPIPHELP
ncbi:MAG: zinc-ribbon domain-containing protein, partial [Gammaproteobacteria bacterium]|nr:zinc-ribbon domain-containing protein [Gammaproteobacteria bacterium]